MIKDERLPERNEHGQHFTNVDEALESKVWLSAALQVALAALTDIECVVSARQARKIAMQTRIGIAVSSGVLTEEQGLAEMASMSSLDTNTAAVPKEKGDVLLAA